MVKLVRCGDDRRGQADHGDVSRLRRRSHQTLGERQPDANRDVPMVHGGPDVSAADREMARETARTVAMTQAETAAILADLNGGHPALRVIRGGKQ